MRQLLDTHIVLWFLNGEKLSPELCERIISGANCVSVVSLWEVAIKMNIGKYEFIGGFSAFCELIKSNDFEDQWLLLISHYANHIILTINNLSSLAKKSKFFKVVMS